MLFNKFKTTARLCIGTKIKYNLFMPIPNKYNKCLNCAKETSNIKSKYCSNACQIEYQYLSYIERWKEGRESGLKTIGIVSRPIKRYLRRKFGDKCCLCGWSKINVKTGKVPLVADHIDGNWRNNTEENLRLICPNCDAISPTYANLNKGNGRDNRVISNRAKEGRLLAGKRQDSSVGRATHS